MALSPLGVQLFGGFHLTYGDVALRDINRPRMQSLLAYLILHAGTLQARQHIAFLFWPDLPEAHARNNLRQLLHQLRQVLPESSRFLTLDAQTVGWRSDDGQNIDVQIFRRALADAEAAARRANLDAEQSALQHALTVYQGDLFPACYDDWIASERERLRQQCQAACRRLAYIFEQQRQYAEALEATQQLLRLDPLDELTYVALMRLHELNGDKAGAQRIYQTAAKMLQRELGVNPGAELSAAYERLQHVSPVVTPAGVETPSTSAPFSLVGRQAEWQHLQKAWGRAVNGHPHLVLIRGEAGIGKSRLAGELFDWATRQGFTTAYARSYDAEWRLSLAPVTEWLRSGALRPHLAALDGVWLTEITRLLPELLTENSNLAQPEPITEYGRRQRFFEALARGIVAAPRPILLWIDDLQWCDQATLEWLHFLLRFGQRHALLVVGTVRSEESLPEHPTSLLMRQLQMEEKVAVLDLSPLDAAETAQLAAQVQGQTPDVATTMALYRETAGNPLFVVETIRAVMTGAVTSAMNETPASTVFAVRKLPPRVHVTIAGRLAQLSPAARKVAEVSAAIGRAFTFDLLLSAGTGDEEAVAQALDELWQRRIIREQSANLFDFTHDTLRDVAYAEISAPQRRFLHRRIAQALETVHSQSLDAVNSEIAAQYEQAGMFAQAVPYYQRAGAVAASVYANEGAISLFTRGLELLAELPASPLRDAQELNIQLALARLYRFTSGWASPEVERALMRAMELSEKVDDVDQRIQTLFGLQTLYVVRAQHEKVEQTYNQAETLFKAMKQAPPPFAGISLAGAKLCMGQMLEARELFEVVVAVRDDNRIRDLQESHGLNYLVHGLAWNSHALWCLGYPKAAFTAAQTAIDLAQQFAQPFNQALAITYLALLQEWRADAASFGAHAAAACALMGEYKAHYYRAWTNILVHFAQGWQQPDADHLARLRDAIAGFAQTGARIRLPVYYSQLARVCQRAGRFEEGLDVIEQAFAESRQNREQWWDAELYRLHGELRWAQEADPDEVEATFNRALEVAQRQQARSLELRAAMSLSRLLRTTGRPAAAKHILQPVYGWFTEGFDTPDLQTAQALLAQL